MNGLISDQDLFDAAPAMYDSIAFYFQELDKQDGDLTRARAMMAEALAIADGTIAGEPHSLPPLDKHDNKSLILAFAETSEECREVYAGPGAARRAASLRMSLKHFDLEDRMTVTRRGSAVFLARKV